MNVEQQQGRLYQRLLFETSTENLRHGEGGAGSTQSSPREEQQSFTATDPARALTQHLMEEFVDRENLNQAYRQGKAHRGAAGVDGMTILGGSEVDCYSQGVLDRFAHRRQLSTRSGSRSANSQAGRRGALIGHPEGD